MGSFFDGNSVAELAMALENIAQERFQASYREETEEGVGGEGWIRTSVGEANGFTVRPL